MSHSIGLGCRSALVALALAGCGGHATAPRPTATPTATVPEAQATASPTPTPAGPWSAPIAGHRTPLPCPVASSRAGWPSRVLDLGEHSYTKLWGRRPRLASVDAQGHLYDQLPLGARQATPVRALTCFRNGRTVAAWTEDHGRSTSLRVALRPDETVTVDSARGLYDQPGIGDVALAFTPDGELLIAYSLLLEVRAVTVSASDAVGEPVTLGPATEVTRIAAESSRSGRTVVAWTTIDAGEERNERRRIYAVTGHDTRFGPPRLVDRARHLDIAGATSVPIRLDVAPNGRALLLWGVDRKGTDSLEDSYLVRVAEASPHGSFGTPRQLSSDGTPGDVAVQSDGRALAVWRTWAGLRASVHAAGRRFHTHEIVTDEPVGEPDALFDRGHPRVEWADGFSERERP